MMNQKRKRKKKKMKNERGQGLVEYALILVLIAITVIVILAVLGPLVKNVFVALEHKSPTTVVQETPTTPERVIVERSWYEVSPPPNFAGRCYESRHQYYSE